MATILKTFKAAALMVFFAIGGTSAHAQDMKEIKIGWQPTAINSAQMIHALARTDILQRNGLKGNFQMFTFGPPVNEALVSGAIDIGVLGDLPSISLTAIGAPVKIIARTTNFGAGILTSPQSRIQSIKDLKGKKIYGPVGTAAFLAVRDLLAQNGLEAGKDVEIINLSFGEIADALKAGSIETFFVWEPWVTYYQKKGFARTVATDPNLLLVLVARQDFLAKNPDAIEKFLKSYREAMLFAARNQELANRWFVEPAPARMLGEDVVQTSALLEPSWSAKSLADVRVSISPTEMERYLRIADEAYKLKILLKPTDLKKSIDDNIARKVDAATWDFDPGKVKIQN